MSGKRNGATLCIKNYLGFEEQKHSLDAGNTQKYGLTRGNSVLGRLKGGWSWV